MSQSVALSGLPQSFVEAMRKLFDILDKEASGWVDINEISSRWHPQDDMEEHLPRNIIDNLSKVVNADGKLSFERFCAGLKIAILRHESEKRRNEDNERELFRNAPPSIDDDDDSPQRCSSSSGGFHHHGSSSINRTSSLPNLDPTGDNSRLKLFTPSSPVPSEPCQVSSTTDDPRRYHRLSIGPPKPPRDPLRMSGLFSRTSIQNDFLGNDPWTMDMPMRGGGGGHLVDSQNHTQRRPVKRRDSHLRRHTLQGGIDVSMMKRLKQWEEEKSVLEEGLRIIQGSHRWYLNRLKSVQDKLKFGADPSSPSVNSEAMQERLMFELQSIRELNQRLKCLVESGRPGGFPSHINLQVGDAAFGNGGEGQQQQQQQQHHQFLLLERQVDRLKLQNKMLTEEVGRKSNAITKVEQEKSLLIRQLFQARSIMSLARPPPPPPSPMQQQQYKTANDTTFM